MSTETRQLSEREIEILRLVAAGLSNQQIANHLGVSINTIKVHLRNVFGKIGAASRTEATLYAVRTGLVTVDRTGPSPSSTAEAVVDEPVPASTGEPRDPQPVQPGMERAVLPDVVPPQIEVEPETTEDEPAETSSSAVPAVIDTPSVATVPVSRATRRQRWVIGGLLLLVLVTGGIIASIRGLPDGSTATGVDQPADVARAEQARWKELSAAPTARSAFAVANLGGLMYVIGGENQSGVLAGVERFDTNSQTWTTLSAKPIPVTDVHAAVLGGRIYVPGGRRSANPADISDAFERYDPRLETWESLPPLPQPRSAYALAVLEGKIYLLGGWDGAKVRSEVFVYDPDAQAWTERTPMPTPRAYAGAGAVEGSIYIVGGENESGRLASNEMYVPAEDHSGGQPWARRAPMREPRSRFGTAVVLSSIHIIGGTPGTSPQVKYDTLTDSWHVLGTPPKPIGSQPGVVLVETTFVTLGGKQGADQYSADVQSYQALFNFYVPGP